MRQAGVIAAAGVVALETMVERLADDHARARTLAEVLADVFPGSVDPEGVETNIVCARAGALPADFLDALEAEGVRAGTIDVETVRLVTHHDVDDDGLARAVDALRRIGRRG
jgi:threonine aldolase